MQHKTKMKPMTGKSSTSIYAVRVTYGCVWNRSRTSRSKWKKHSRL